MESLADQVKAALEANDIQKAYSLSAELSTGVFRMAKANEPTAQQKYESMLQTPMFGPRGSWLDLSQLAKAAYDAGQLEAAEGYAKELLAKYSDPKGYSGPKGTSGSGEAVFIGNMVLGRVALRRNQDIPEAKNRLLASAYTVGSPALNSFGPNMSLAKELLEKGERDTVLEFFTRCRTFWTMGQNKLDDWTATVKGGGIPDFRANLLY